MDRNLILNIAHDFEFVKYFGGRFEDKAKKFKKLLTLAR